MTIGVMSEVLEMRDLREIKNMLKHEYANYDYLMKNIDKSPSIDYDKMIDISLNKINLLKWVLEDEN